MLRDYALHLKTHHLEAVAMENLRLLRELDVPLMRLFQDMPEEQMRQMVITSMDTFLTQLAAGTALEAAQQSLIAWENDQLPGIPKDAVQPGDLVLVYAAQKQSLLKFLPTYFAATADAVPMLTQVESYYTKTQQAAFELFARLRQEAGEREARLHMEKEASERENEELHSMNEELQTQQEELESLYEQLQEQHERTEAEVAKRTEELRQTNAALRQADRYKDEFLSVISHELRTPLNFITGFASILDDEIDGPLNEKQHLHLGKILSGSDRMLSLVNDLLDFAKLQAGKFDLQPEPTPYGPLVEEVVSTMRPLADHKGVQLVVDVDVPTEPFVDETRIIQVLTNLINNAIKFTPRGGTIRLSAAVENGQLITRVADTGMGIAKADIPKLFNRFRQLDMSTTRSAGGTGLGLAISKALIEAHGGHIGVESTMGEGSTFWFRVPMSGAHKGRIKAQRAKSN